MTKTRAEIPAQYKWDLTAIYKDQKEFESCYEKAKQMIDAFPSHEKTMTQSAEKLYRMFCDDTAINRLLSKLFVYTHLNSDTDKSDNFFLAQTGRMVNLINNYSAASFFVSPLLIRLDENVLEKWYQEYPALTEYRRSIELSQRLKPYTLSDECEKLMADMQNSLHSHSEIRTIFADADLRFGKISDKEGKKVQLSDATYIPMMMDSLRRVRRAAFVKLYETYSEFGNTFSALLHAFVKEKTNVAKIRGYENSLQASVFSDEVTPDIYNNLIDTVNKNLEPLYRYYDLKKEVLGLSNLHMYDLYCPLIQSCVKEYSFEEAVEEVLNTVKLFGNEYHDTLENGIKNQNWIDVYPNKGKRNGAYSSGCYDTQPYILLNYTSQLDDVSTLAHEAGHSMHSYFSQKYNAPQNADYTIFVAEVASTVNELLYAHKKLHETSNDDEKLCILNQLLETYKGTLFRQTMFAEFEKKIHLLCENGETLTKDLLCKEYYALVKKYFGPNVVCDKQIALEWMRIPHFYRNFYVYKYATCISAASSIVKKLRTGDKAYINSYIDFLKCGGSKSPLDSLRVAGIDLTKPEVIEDAISDFSETIDLFRSILNKKR